ncbi:ester cyclase [Maribacter polysaccharolyticus]|uniref:ester cyclase n=1 Tax=Maribacter polysaccharolyticus TaxID=3020831 RepID=UPI00237F0D52|nr:ester cyclase [Maribacter polysaccharolyticus]MDE3740795.1 ester cyclase [Maribacter polysaccharolyticus]
MKKSSILIFTAILLMGCQQKAAERYTQQSPQIDTVKKLLANYTGKTYDTSMYADTAKTYYNSIGNPMSPAETIAYHQQNDANYSSRGFLEEDQEYEMAITDDGKTWVNAWLHWKGTLAGNGQVVDIPIHLTYQFIDGKIVREYGYWDPTEVVLALQKMEAEKSMSVEEKTVQSTVDNITKAWNANDKALMASHMTSDFIRTENGNIIAKNPQEYAGFMDIYFEAFPDFTVKIDKSSVQGNKAYIYWTCTGTNTGKFMDNDPTDKKIMTHGFSVWTLDRDGKCEREDAFYDKMVLLEQLGMAPSI